MSITARSILLALSAAFLSGSALLVCQPAAHAAPAPLASSSTGLATAPSARNAAPGTLSVDDLNVTVKGDAVQLSYKPSKPGMNLVVYRGTSAMTEPADLLDATIIATFADRNGSFVDYPVPGIEYWYAILGENDLKAGSILLWPGHNVTAQAFGIGVGEPGKSVPAPKRRMSPLPALVLDRAPEEGAAALPPLMTSPPPVKLEAETARAVALLLAGAPTAEPVMPQLVILPEERASPSGGEEYTLSLIISGKFRSGDWQASVSELRDYLSLNRSRAVSARVHFYLGEALTHAGAYRDAFFELLTARRDYLVETKPWIDYVLYRLRNE